jgi:hypothetical protein
VKNLLDRGLLDEILWEVEIAIVFAVVVAVSSSQPFDEGSLG